MSAPSKTAPAPFDARQLAETVDTMALLLASLSDRIDAQGRLLEKVRQTAMDRECKGERTDRGNHQVDKLVQAMGGQIEVVNLVFQEVVPFLRIIGPREVERREKLERLRRWLPALLGVAFALGVVLTLVGVRLA